MTSELNTLSARLEQLEQDNAAMRADNTQLKTQFHTAQRRLRVQASLAFVAFLAAVFLSPGNRAALAQGYGVTLASLNTRLMAVEAKTQYQSVDTTAKSVTFSGCNLVVNNGLGATNGNPADPLSAFTTTVNGLGNLILGYNESRVSSNDTDLRSGSHNLIVGIQQNYTSFGGIVVGQDNTISAPFASVSGGVTNTASGPFASVSGGAINTASGGNASISGGNNNKASNSASSISGGSGNIASGVTSSVSGGQGNTASSIFQLDGRRFVPQPVTSAFS